MDRIGVRELRQHASRYLARVAAGESLEVTDRGRPVALLVPVSPDPWDELLERGLARAPADSGDLLDLEPLTLPPEREPLSEAVIRLRDEER
jgi:prevent-host-death family protein